MKKSRLLKIAKIFSLFLVAAASVSCGVKGDPIPPGTPAELGRGKPSYRRATEPLAFPVVPPPSEKTDEEEKENKNEF